MSRLMRCAVLGLFALAPAGCGGGVKEESIPIKSTDPMAQVTSTLRAYAQGQPLGSEVTSFEYMVNEVRKVDAAKADVLQAGLDEIQKAKGGPAAKAKELLKKLGLAEK